jgi:hypothetical protein
MSRKLIFVSGLLNCFSCNLNEELQAKVSTDERDIQTARSVNLAHLQDHILQRVRQTPLDIVALATMEYGIDGEIAEKLFSAYNEFLGLVADPEKRARLKALRAETSRTDPVFKEVQDFSVRFSDALNEIFFSSPQLGSLTRKYGVF